MVWINEGNNIKKTRKRKLLDQFLSGQFSTKNFMRLGQGCNITVVFFIQNIVTHYGDHSSKSFMRQTKDPKETLFCFEIRQHKKKHSWSMISFNFLAKKFHFYSKISCKKPIKEQTRTDKIRIIKAKVQHTHKQQHWISSADSHLTLELLLPEEILRFYYYFFFVFICCKVVAELMAKNILLNIFFILSPFLIFFSMHLWFWLCFDLFV